MDSPVIPEFPLFPLGLVVLPHELIPLHIFEDRYKTMMGHCLDERCEFGIVWLGEGGLRDVGCACEIAEVLERLPDGRINLIARGTRPFRLVARQDHLPYPAGVVELSEDRGEPPDERAGEQAREAYATLVESVSDTRPDAEALAERDAYGLAATIELGLDAKQGLLELRSENARLRLITRLFRAADKRLQLVARARERASANGKVRFG